MSLEPKIPADRRNVRLDLYEVGDEVRWNLPTVMAHCRTWVPDLTKRFVIVEVQPIGDALIDSEPMERAAGHTQLVCVSPSPSPYGDKFSGAWFEPIDRSAR